MIKKSHQDLQLRLQEHQFDKAEFPAPTCTTIQKLTCVMNLTNQDIAIETCEVVGTNAMYKH